MNAVWNDLAADDVDLGDDPPLVTGDSADALPDRRRVSLRWLAGTVLAAMASTSLMGGALYVALDGRESMAMPVEAARDSSEAPTVLSSAAAMPKGDLIRPESAGAVTRQVLRVSTIQRDGEKDIVRLRPFARISAPLVTRSDEVVDAIPSFDPLRIFADVNVEAVDTMTDTLYGAAVDGQMTMRVVDFPVADASLPADSPMDPAAIEVVVRDAAQFLDGSNVEVAALPLPDPTRFDFGFEAPGAFERTGVRIVPENVSFIAGSGEAGFGQTGSYREEKTVTAKKGDALADLLTANEATDEEAGEITLQFRKLFDVVALKTGDRLRIVLGPANDETGRFQPIRISLYRDQAHVGTVALSDHLGYVGAEEPRGEADDVFQTATETDDRGESSRPRLYESLYQTALANSMSPSLIDELVRIYSFDLDFNARVTPGDSIEVVYSLDEDESESAEASEIVFTSITVGGKVRRFYRFKAPDDGSVDYYDPEGNSAKKFLLRKPMSGGTFRSGFGSRRHPLLGYTKMHTGVDWAASPGTPIMAAGDGVVNYADWKSGYGNYIKIQHNNGYETAYAHQTRFASGIRKGVRVRQGQVIGYVGSTGLSTGPHLHYEVLVNGNYVDPMRVRLPRGRLLEGETLSVYNQERDRIDTLLGVGAPAKLASAGSGAGG